MTTTRIILPAPPRALYPNKRNGRHWGETNAARSKYRRDCWYATLSQAGRACVVPDGDFPLLVTLGYEGKRPDADGALSAAKAGLDGVADALKVNDNRFEPVTISRRNIVTLGWQSPALIVEF